MKLSDTIRGFKEILDGKHDDKNEQAFYMKGRIDEVQSSKVYFRKSKLNLATNEIKFKIVTPERTVYEAEIDQVTLPTQEGEITVLPDHIPLISVLAPGELVARKNGEEIAMAVSGGMIEVRKNEITILADTAERAEEIDIKRAEEARERAEKLKDEKIRMDETEYAAVAALMERNLARIRVAKKHLTRRGMNWNIEVRNIDLVYL